MNMFKLFGKYIYIEVDLGKFYGGVYFFFFIMLLDDYVIVGMCWKKWSLGKLVGLLGDLYGVVQDLLDSVRFFMVVKLRWFVGVKLDIVREYGFQVGEDFLIYFVILVVDLVFIFFERKNDVVKIYYYNQFFYEIDCLEFKGMGRGIIELFFLEFVNDVFEILEGYFKNYVGVIEWIMREYEEELYDYDIFWRWYLEIKEEIIGRRI